MKSQTNIVFNGCVFDFKTNFPAATETVAKPTLFDLSDNNGYTNLINVNLEINGGEILCDNISNVTLSAVNTG